MHDIRAIRENPDLLDAALARRGDDAMSSKVLALDEARRAKIGAAEAAQAEQTFYAHDRLTVRELASLWQPGTPASENQAYINRSRELEKDLETALLELAEKKEQDRS